MSYNQLRLLDRIAKVQEVWQKYNLDDRTNEWIYEHHIEHQFHISKKTFYNYINTNVTKQRRMVQERMQSKADENQLKLWEEESE